MKRRGYAHQFFIVCFLLIGYGCFRILQPFIVPILWAAVLVVTFAPLHRHLTAWLRGRRRLASALTCLLITATILLPCFLLFIALARESVEAYQSLQELVRSPDFESSFRLKSGALMRSVSETAGQLVDIEAANIESMFVSALGRISSFLVDSLKGLVAGFAGFIAHFLIMLLTMYFFFVDGKTILERLRELSPLPAGYETVIIRQLKGTSAAILQGNVLTALVQGAAGATVFLILGLPSPLLWGTAMAFGSFIPVFGTSLIWMPAALYLFVIGDLARAIGLAVGGALFISMLDNFIKPQLMKGKMKIHTLLVFFSILGGLSVFGLAGIIVGPLIMTLFQTFLMIYRAEYQDELATDK